MPSLTERAARAARAGRRNAVPLVIVLVFVTTPAYFAFGGPGTTALIVRQ